MSPKHPGPQPHASPPPRPTQWLPSLYPLAHPSQPIAIRRGAGSHSRRGRPPRSGPSPLRGLSHHVSSLGPRYSTPPCAKGGTPHDRAISRMGVADPTVSRIRSPGSALTCTVQRAAQDITLRCRTYSTRSWELGKGGVETRARETATGSRLCASAGARAAEQGPGRTVRELPCDAGMCRRADRDGRLRGGC